MRTRSINIARFSSSSSLRLSVGGCMIPDRRKLPDSPLGEDAFFTSHSSFGVADGVGGWALKGIDSGHFSRALMRHAQDYFEQKHKSNNDIDPKLAMEYAEQETIQSGLLGTSTMCALCVDGEVLRSALVGDSGFALLRQEGRKPDGSYTSTSTLTTTQTPLWKVVYKSQEQQHSFNMPFQIGLNSRTKCKRHAMSMHIPLFRGDVVVCGTDGLFDNLWLKEMCLLLDEDRDDEDMNAEALARKLAETAVKQSRMPHKRSPYSTQASRFGHSSSDKGGPGGGKQDDVTCVVALVR